MVGRSINKYRNQAWRIRMLAQRSASSYPHKGIKAATYCIILDANPAHQKQLKQNVLHPISPHTHSAACPTGQKSILKNLIAHSSVSELDNLGRWLITIQSQGVAGELEEDAALRNTANRLSENMKVSQEESGKQTQQSTPVSIILRNSLTGGVYIFPIGLKAGAGLPLAFCGGSSRGFGGGSPQSLQQQIYRIFQRSIGWNNFRLGVTLFVTACDLSILSHPLVALVSSQIYFPSQNPSLFFGSPKNLFSAALSQQYYYLFMKMISMDDECDQHQYPEPAKPRPQMSNLRFYLIAVALRLVVGLLLIRTFHKGDEYFQGPEVAHRMVFGTGQLSWEWVFKDPLRGPLFPSYYAIGYWISKILCVDRFLGLFTSLPYIQQSFLAALFDLLLVKINSMYNGKSTTHILLFFNWAGWATLTYLSRTYVNSAQAVITMAAFYFWLKRNQDQKYDRYSRLLATLGFVIRGTSVIFWVIVWPYELLRYHVTLDSATKFIKKNVLTVVGMVASSILVSSIYYGRLIWVDYNFFYYNLMLNWSKLAGVSAFAEYFTHYQYKAFNVAVLFLVWGVLMSFRLTKDRVSDERNTKFRQLFMINFLCILFLSYNQHKELRFLLVYFPYLLIFIVKGYYEFPSTIVKRTLLLVFLGISFYEYALRNFYVFNSQIEMVKYVRDNPHITNLYLLTGSFGMPMYCFIHRPIDIKQVQYRYDDAMEGRKSEKQEFYETPNVFLHKIMERYPNLTHIITRKGQVDDLQIEKLSFDLEYQVKHPYFPNLALEFHLWRVVHEDANQAAPTKEQMQPGLREDGQHAIELEQTPVIKSEEAPYI